MPFGNYTELVAEVSDYLARGTELDSKIPTFITLTEDKVNKRLRQSGRSKRGTITTDADGIAALPADFHSMRTAGFDEPYRAALRQVAPYEAANMSLNAGTIHSFAIVDRSMHVYPPGIATVTLDYIPKIPALTALTPTNWLLSESPRIYLYGALMEAQPYMQNDTRLASWKALFEEALEELISSEASSQWSRGRMTILEATP